jgi:hypothetical protein
LSEASAPLDNARAHRRTSLFSNLLTSRPIFGVAHFRAGALHVVERLIRVIGFQIDATHRVFEHYDLEPFAQAIERGLLNAIVRGQTADEKPFDAALAQQVRQSKSVRVHSIETGIAIRILFRTLGDNDGALPKGEIGVELCALRILDTVRRPHSALSVEMNRAFGMPVAGGNDRQSGTIKLGDQTIEDGDDLVPFTHS